MTGFIGNIEQSTLSNDNFRKVLYTAEHLQLVLMTLQPGENIGAEVHGATDQFIRVESGHGQLILNGQHSAIKDGSAFIIPAGSAHDVVNTSLSEPLRLYSLYAPPEHPEGAIVRRKSKT